MKKIYTSIDIGSYSIKMVVSEYYNNKFYTLTSQEIKSEGIKKGLIVDAEAVIDKLKKVVQEVNLSLGVSINKIIVNIPDYGTKFLHVSNSIAFHENHKITSNDINKIIKDSIYNKISDDFELVTMVTSYYKLDNNFVSKPVDKIGQNLEVDGIIISTPKKNIYSVLKVVEAAGLEVVDIVINGLANYYECCDVSFNNKDGVIIDVGHSTTNVSIFEQGVIVSNETLQIGGINIEKDLSYVFGISIDDARCLKEDFAYAHKRFCKLSETYEVKKISSELVKLNQLEVSEVVMSRLIEILMLAKKQIRMLTQNEISYIVLTGGLTEFRAFRNVAVEIFGKDVLVHNSSIVGCRDNKFSCALGMIKYFNNKMETRGKDVSMLDIESEINLITPDNKNRKDNIMINKYFGDFMVNKEEG